ncbi:MAG TPA: alpha/beta hydrolase [Gemmatimonadaceae bacterium]|jgi:pimeloyl-ACP methyl ester carboxylesterase|nr:alpha/beta hydrolase [Gemmatimonadaceae bacterium]
MQADVLRIPVGPGAVHVERYGHGGDPVILLHGFGTCAFLWRTVAPMIAEAGYTAYAIDLFGHGESDRTPDADFGIAAQAEYLDAAMTALRVARATVVGNDLGGDVALRLAATREERVGHLVLINTPAFDELPARDITTMQLSTARFAFQVTRGVLGAAPLVQHVLEGSVAKGAHMPTRLIARYLAPFAGEDGVNHLLRLAAAIRRDDVEDLDLGRVRMPTLIVRGDADLWVTREVADRLVANIPNARLAHLRGVGRLIAEEDPVWLCEQLCQFIGAERTVH